MGNCAAYEEDTSRLDQNRIERKDEIKKSLKLRLA